MTTLRVYALVFTSWLTKLLLYFTAVTAVFVLTFGNSRTIKRVLIETHAYERVVPAIIQTNIDQKQNTGSIPLKDREVQAIILRSFPPDDLQAKSETFINAFYDWLEGRSEKLKFTINFQPNISLVANGLSEHAFNRLAPQSLCIENSDKIDPFTSNCRPQNIDLVEAKIALEDDIKAPGNILPKPIITAADMPRNQQNKTIAEQYPELPIWFNWAKQAPWLLSFFTLLSAICYLWMSRIKRSAIKQLGRSVISNGILLCFTPLVFGFLLPRYTNNLQTGFGGSSAQIVMSDVSRALTKEFNTWLLIIGFMVTLLGFAIIVLERATLPRSKYAGLKKRSGLVSSIAKRSYNGRFILDPGKVPLISSEISTTKQPKRKTDKKYRKIPSKEL